MHNVFVSNFLSKGRNFKKPVGGITLAWLLLLLLTPPMLVHCFKVLQL